MARTNTLTNFLTDVADAIRSKTGKSEAIACEDFDTEIESISGGGVPNLQTKSVTITANGTTNITADSGYDGLEQVNLTTNVPSGSDVPIISEDEVVVGTWIDDKPLYMKTLLGTISTNSSGAFNTTLDTNISDTLDVLFLGENSYMYATDNNFYPVNYTNITSNGAMYLVKTVPSRTNRNIASITYGNLFPNNSTVNYVINVFYVKTTDTPVSDVSTIKGNHFSQNEHIVDISSTGVYTYEKTIETSTYYGNNNPIKKTIAHNIQNVDKIWIANGSFCFGQNHSGKNTFPLNYWNHYQNGYRQHIHTNIDKTNIKLYVGDWVITQGYVWHYITLRYTKATT